MLCPWAKKFRRFERLYCFHRQDWSQFDAVDLLSPNMQYLTRWRSKLIRFFSSKFVCPFWSSSHSWALYLGIQVDFYTSCSYSRWRNLFWKWRKYDLSKLGNFTPKDKASQPRRANVFLLLIRGIYVSVKSFPTYGVSTYRSALLLFAPRPNLLNQARKYLRTLLNKSSRCRTPKIKRPRSTILLQFGSKTPWNKPRKLNLSLRRGPKRFWS